MKARAGSSRSPAQEEATLSVAPSPQVMHPKLSVKVGHSPNYDLDSSVRPSHYPLHYPPCPSEQ